MVYNRKLKSCTRRKFYLVLCVILSFTSFITYFFFLSETCFQRSVESTIDHICDQYDLLKVRGDLCHDICLEKLIHNFHCGSGIYNNYQMIMGYHKNDKVILVRVNTHKNLNKLYWVDKQKHLRYPTKNEFTKIIQRTLFFMYNMTLPSDKIGKLLAFIDNRNTAINQNYMETVWQFIHSNDYILANLMEKEELFPKIYGICANYYVKEYVDPLVENTEAGEISEQEWKIRIKASILILDFVEELNNYQTPLTICDANVLHFAISNDRLKYHDVRYIYTQKFIDKHLSDAKSCKKNADCDYFNCQGKCDPDLNLCVNKQMNNNLHVICTKIFKGHSYTPGILITSYSSTKLLDLIDRCASPQMKKDVDMDRIYGPSKVVRDELYAELANIYEILATKN